MPETASEAVMSMPRRFSSGLCAWSLRGRKEDLAEAHRQIALVYSGQVFGDRTGQMLANLRPNRLPQKPQKLRRRENSQGFVLSPRQRCLQQFTKPVNEPLLFDDVRRVRRRPRGAMPRFHPVRAPTRVVGHEFLRLGTPQRIIHRLLQMKRLAPSARREDSSSRGIGDDNPPEHAFSCAPTEGVRHSHTGRMLCRRVRDCGGCHDEFL